jgi:hypothetical protein
LPTVHFIQIDCPREINKIDVYSYDLSNYEEIFHPLELAAAHACGVNIPEKAITWKEVSRDDARFSERIGI